MKNLKILLYIDMMIIEIFIFINIYSQLKVKTWVILIIINLSVYIPR